VPALENQRHELFAQELARGKNISAAYVSAGYQPCRQNAHRMTTRDDIKERVVELKEQRETDTKNGRDPETGQFLVGHSGNGGRPKGSRNKLATEFLDALHLDFQQNGASAIKRVAADDPVQYLKLVAQILPRELDVALHVDSDLFSDCRSFVEAWHLAEKVIGIGTDKGKLLELDAEFVADRESDE
jgi:hypothetical protein